MIKWSWTKSHLHILILIFKMKYKNTTLYQAKCNELDSNCSVSIQDLRNRLYFYILNTTLGRLGDDHNQFNKVFLAECSAICKRCHMINSVVPE